MRGPRTVVSRIGVGLSVLALACNAVIPMFLAFMLAAALGPTRHEWVRLADGAWLYYGPLCSHGAAGGSTHEQGQSHGAVCPVCSLHGTLAVALSAPIAAPHDPLPIALPRLPPTVIAAPASTFSAGYRSRAPPPAA
jgi:hypothetical protein